jgi:hypothetical protein
MERIEDGKPPVEQSEAYLKAFDHLNRELFQGDLIRPMLCLTRDAGIHRGYFCANAWVNDEDELINEIALNANWLVTQDLVGAMTVLAHEMVHHWQTDHGKPGRGGYHNLEWAQKAKSIGLQPYGPHGEEIGDKIDTKLIPGSLLEEAIRSMPEEAVLPWIAAGVTEDFNRPRNGKPLPEGEEKPSRGGKRSNYTCPSCGLNAWAKAGVSLICGSCSREMGEAL